MGGREEGKKMKWKIRWEVSRMEDKEEGKGSKEGRTKKVRSKKR